MLKFTVQTIKLYQAINQLFLRHGAGSFLLYPSCNFYPSCSEYAIESFKKHGFKKGIIRTVGRIFKCHPWTKPRVDFP